MAVIILTASIGRRAKSTSAIQIKEPKLRPYTAAMPNVDHGGGKMVKRLVLGMAGCFVFSHFLIFYPNISRELSDLFVLSFVQYLLVCVVFNNIFTFFSFSISQAMATLFIIYSFSMR